MLEPFESISLLYLLLCDKDGTLHTPHAGRAPLRKLTKHEKHKNIPKSGYCLCCSCVMVCYNSKRNPACKYSFASLPERNSLQRASSFKIIIVTFQKHHTMWVCFCIKASSALQEKWAKLKGARCALCNYYHSPAPHGEERALRSGVVASTELNIFNIWKQLLC